MSRVAWGALTVLLGLATAAVSEAPDPLRFFPCAAVQFFGEACAPVAVPVVVVPAAPAVPASAPTPEPLTPDAAGETPERPESLFPPQTLAPDTPPLLLQLLHTPTEANARAYLAWQQARIQRIREVQALLRILQAAEAERTRQAEHHPEPSRREDSGCDATGIGTARRTSVACSLP
jgi:hypothetical protein